MVISTLEKTRLLFALKNWNIKLDTLSNYEQITSRALR